MMQQSYPGINPSISEWKGQEITDFQEELLKKVNAHLSEKWFYTHMKGVHASLPRIDVLNLLSKYAGYANWDDFLFKTRERSPSGQTGSVQKGITRLALTRNPNRFFILVPVFAIVLVVIFYGIFKMFNTREYTFTFYDSDTREPITGNKIEVMLLPDGESPITFFSDSSGRYSMKTDQSKVKMVVSAPFYKTDTIIRILKKLKQQEMIGLHADTYALMIHYFSKMKVNDWEKRRRSLDNMIDDGAIICQVFEDKDPIGVELFNKQEFIDRLTIPSASLKNMEILNTKTRGEKIVILWYRVNPESR